MTRRPWYRRPCLNCSEPGRCLCWSCLRVMIVPVLVIEFVRWWFR